MHRALEIADRAYVLSVGSVVASGPTDSLVEGELERSYLGIGQAGMTPSEFVQQLVNALSLGSIYALLALGLSMVYGVMGMLNFAYGELVTITRLRDARGHLPAVRRSSSSRSSASSRPASRRC